ncbi:MAG: radical SAM protein [Candidatus Micrarchaeia archaeon]|jgi:radical SAM superfamily enzyme YgiQ (UPF0313 family)
MKISISYPPIETPKGIPLLAQNRQFQYFNEPTYIYPMVPAYAATLLKAEGHEVVWDDAIAQGKTYAQWLEDFCKASPDLVAIEAKTPIIKRYWQVIAEIKRVQPKTKVVLMGDHVTALPLESFEKSPVDFVITGGDYDFSLRDLAKSIEKGKPYGPGVYWREKNAVKNTGHFCISNDLNELPFIDRDLTRWKDYAYKNGNYKRTPGTYTMVGRDCWWGKCTFCSWTTTYKGYRTRSPQSLLDEIGVLIEKYGVKEVFDDSGSFPAGKWLEEFCKGMIERGYNKKIYFSCNMRFGGCTPELYALMKKANFRFMLFGLESANAETLKRLNKGTTPELCVESCKQCSKAGLFPHVTIMIGYPWETKEDAQRTVRLGRFLLKKGFAHTLQATIPIPYPGTPLFKECEQKGWLLTRDWDDYDMRRPVMKTPYPPEEVKKMVQELYKVAYHPEFVARKIASIRDIDDVKFFARAAKKVVGHLADFGNQKRAKNDGRPAEKRNC